MTEQRMRRSTQTTHEAIAWFQDYYQTNGRMPKDVEIEALRGPTPRLRRRMGGLPGIAAAIGIEGRAPRQYHYDDETALASLTSWVIRRGTDTVPTADSLTEADQIHDLSLRSPMSYTRRFGSWRKALEKTGFYQFTWAASECVAFARQTQLELPELNLRLGLQANNRQGLTPLFSDVREFYPSIRDLSYWRLSWDKWGRPNHARLDITRTQRDRDITSILSHGVLALASVGGSMSDFAEGNRMLYKEDRGPDFSKALYAKASPAGMPESTGYIYALDLIERAYNISVNGSGDRHLPLGQLGVSSVAPHNPVHPVFQPELDELRLAA